MSPLLKGAGVKSCSVIGFPPGASRSPDKAAEAYSVLSAGATRIGTGAGVAMIKEARVAASAV